jgi:hypothetical protein
LKWKEKDVPSDMLVKSIVNAGAQSLSLGFVCPQWEQEAQQ